MKKLLSIEFNKWTKIWIEKWEILLKNDDYILKINYDDWTLKKQKLKLHDIKDILKDIDKKLFPLDNEKNVSDLIEVICIKVAEKYKKQFLHENKNWVFWNKRHKEVMDIFYQDEKDMNIYFHEFKNYIINFLTNDELEEDNNVRELRENLKQYLEKNNINENLDNFSLKDFKEHYFRWNEKMYLLNMIREWDINRIERILEEENININLQEENWGWFPLLAASADWKTRIVKLLLKKWAEVDMKNYIWITSLIYASHYWLIDIVKLLVNSWADLNIQEYQYWHTALMDSIAENNLNVAKYLINRWAKLNLKSNNNYTAYELAQKNNLWEICSLIRNKK